MKRNLLSAFVIILMLVAIISCGGGGGGGGTTGAFVGNPVNIRIEAVLAGTETLIDSTNIFANETVQFRLTALDDGAPDAPRKPIQGITWVASNPGSTPSGGTLSSTGLFTAGSTGTLANASALASTSFNGLNFSSLVRTVGRDATLSGRIRLTSGVPVSRIQVLALNSTGTIVATGLSTPEGLLRMTVPTTATRFSINFGVVDPTSTFYIRQFFYNSFDYSTGIAGCTATLPILSSGFTSNLLTDIVVYQISGSTPPPPPNGCN
jgi:hypothetical protein